MKTLLCAAMLSVVCGAAFAAGPAQAPAQTASLSQIPPAQFPAVKQDILTNISTRVSMLQKDYACIQSAQKPADLQACEDASVRAMRAAMEEATRRAEQQRAAAGK